MPGKKLIAWLLAVLATYLVAATLVSFFNMASLRDIGVELTAAHLLGAAWHDITHMYDLYLPIIAVALLIALPVAWWLATRGIADAKYLYPLAGFVALLTVHIAMYLVFGMSAIAATRELPGLLAQGMAGALGGLVYFRLVDAALPGGGNSGAVAT